MTHTERIIHPSVLTGRSVSLLVDELILELERVVKSGDAHIHRIRVNIKKLRAWIRLLKDTPGKMDFKETDHYLANTAKIFSCHRDAEIIPETINWLKKKTDNPGKKKELQKINQHISYRKNLPVFPDEKSSIINKKFLTELKQKSIKVDIEYIIGHGLERTYKKSRRCGKKAFSSNRTLNDLHKFRKWTKYLCYQIEFIQASHPEYYQDEHHLLDKIGKQLGRIHDLDILQQKVNEIKNNKDVCTEAKNVNKLIEEHMQKMYERTKDLYKKAFYHSSHQFQTVKIT